MKNYMRYVIGVLLLVAAIVLLVIGFNVIKNLFKSDKPAKKQVQTTQNTKKVDLLAVSDSDKTVQYTIVGPVNGSEEHRSIRIKVDRNKRTIEVVQGYGNQVLKTQDFPNTPEAYKAFIAALNGAGFANNIAADGRGDEAQSCPLGRTFDYEIAPGTSDSLRTWSNTCSPKKQGTFTGNAPLIQTLFQRQIPQYDKYASDVRLG